MEIVKIIPPKNRLCLKIALTLVIAFAFLAPAQAETVTVCPSGCDYTSIQAAINNASAGDVIEVYSGTYYENVVVNKSITLRGVDSGEGKPVIDGGGGGKPFNITADGVTVDGFVITNSSGGWGNAGIWVKSNNSVISNNTVENNYYGIVMESSNNNLIYNNDISNSSWDGISLYNSNYNIMYNNAISNNCYGIVMSTSNNNTIHHNTLVHSGFSGIEMQYSNYNAIHHNNLVSNGWAGIVITSSSNNTIYLNNFINNTYWNAYSYNSTNIWNSPEKITYTYNGQTFTNYLGNYWDDYNGTDLEGDGIGDAPYSIDGDEDNYPLMERFENYIFEKLSITGAVYEVNEYAGVIAGATVELIKDGTVIDSAMTDENGNYTLIALEKGTYTVKASKEGYAEEEQVITIESYEPVKLDFRYDNGLIPLDPSFDYVLDCIYLWKTGKLSFDTILDVIFYWRT